jgi:hypothetical protein
MHHLLIVVCLIAAVSIQPARGASEKSAQDAIEEAFPHIDYTRGMALFRLLVQLQDGDAVSISIGGASAAFVVRGLDVVVTDKIAGPAGDGTRSVPLDAPIPLPGGPVKHVTALACTVDKDVNLDLYVNELERNNRRVASRTEHTISFYMRTRGSLLTLSDTGAMLVRSAKVLDNLATVDLVMDEAAEALSYLTHKDYDVSARRVADAMREVKVYSDPPHTYKWITFYGQPSNKRWMSSRFTAAITVPEVQVKHARLRQWYLNPRDVFFDVYRATPHVLIDGKEVIEPKISERMYSEDVTELLKPGKHVMQLRMDDNISNATGSEFTIDMVVAPGFETGFEVDASSADAMTSNTSTPLSGIVEDFEAFAEVIIEQ